MTPPPIHTPPLAVRPTLPTPTLPASVKADVWCKRRRRKDRAKRKRFFWVWVRIILSELMLMMVKCCEKKKEREVAVSDGGALCVHVRFTRELLPSSCFALSSPNLDREMACEFHLKSQISII